MEANIFTQHPLGLGVGLSEGGLEHDLLVLALLAGDIHKWFREGVLFLKLT